MLELEIVCVNDEELRICDFIEENKEAIYQNLTRNRQYLIGNEKIVIGVEYYSEFFSSSFAFTTKLTFGVDGISVNDFVKKILRYINRDFNNYCPEYSFSLSGEFFISNWEDFNISHDENGFYLGYFDKECRIKTFDDKFIIYRLEVILKLDEYKIKHKNKFHQKLHDEIFESVWQPRRYLDFEELRALEERWS